MVPHDRYRGTFRRGDKERRIDFILACEELCWNAKATVEHEAWLTMQRNSYMCHRPVVASFEIRGLLGNQKKNWRRPKTLTPDQIVALNLKMAETKQSF
eukprot:6040988-Prorocentrum_lima.AAC.1